MFLVCYILLNSQIISINNSVEKGLVTTTRIPTVYLKKLQKFHKKRSNNWPMVNFIYNGS